MIETAYVSVATHLEVWQPDKRYEGHAEANAKHVVEQPRARQQPAQHCADANAAEQHLQERMPYGLRQSLIWDERRLHESC